MDGSTGVIPDALFDLEEARLAGREGMERAIGTDVAWRWKIRATEVIELLARAGTSFTADDVIRRVGMPPGSPNAVGALIGGLARQGVIVRVGYQPSRRVVTHGRVQGVWVGSQEVSP